MVALIIVDTEEKKLSMQPIVPVLFGRWTVGRDLLKTHVSRDGWRCADLTKPNTLPLTTEFDAL